MVKVADIKTKPTTQTVEDFINAIPDEQKKADSFTLLQLYKEATGENPKMWGTSLIGFGELRYKSPASGREVDWFKIGFSPRKANLSLHLVANPAQNTQLLSQLGKHKTGAGCLYINKLEDVNLDVLKKLIQVALQSKNN